MAHCFSNRIKAKFRPLLGVERSDEDGSRNGDALVNSRTPGNSSRLSAPHGLPEILGSTTGALVLFFIARHHAKSPTPLLVFTNFTGSPPRNLKYVKVIGYHIQKRKDGTEKVWLESANQVGFRHSLEAVPYAITMTARSHSGHLRYLSSTQCQHSDCSVCTVSRAENESAKPLFSKNDGCIRHVASPLLRKPLNRVSRASPPPR